MRDAMNIDNLFFVEFMEVNQRNEISQRDAHLAGDIVREQMRMCVSLCSIVAKTPYSIGQHMQICLCSPSFRTPHHAKAKLSQS